MKVSTSKIAATAAILAVSNALQPAQPARTIPVAVEAALSGFTPKPTAPPSPDLVARRNALYARDSSTVTILYNANNTCGYVSGSRDFAFACANTDDYCALYTAHDNIPGRIACCDTSNCHFQVTCIDYDQYYSSDVCDEACRQDTLTGKCTKSRYPYCNTVSFPGGVLDFACGVNSVVENQLLSSTYKGQTSGGTYLPLVITATDSSTLPGPTPITSPFPNDNPDNTNSGSDSEENGEEKKKGTPVGPIVGGVVGGVGAIGVAALAFVLLRRHKKKKQEKTQQSPGIPPVQPMQQHGPPPPPGSMGPGQQHLSQYYDPAKVGGQAYSSTSPSYGGTSPYQPSSPGYYPSMHSPDANTPQQGMVDPRTGQPSTSPSLSYAQTNSSSPPPQMMMQQQQQQQQQQPQQYYQPSTSPQQIHNAYNAPPQEARGPPDAPVGAVHEAPTDISDQHRGQMHELA